jgi:hypothetical protein
VTEGENCEEEEAGGREERGGVELELGSGAETERGSEVGREGCVSAKEAFIRAEKTLRK